MKNSNYSDLNTNHWDSQTIVMAALLHFRLRVVYNCIYIYTCRPEKGIEIISECIIQLQTKSLIHQQEWEIDAKKTVK